jgi:hypothetical protein
MVEVEVAGGGAEAGRGEDWLEVLWRSTNDEESTPASHLQPAHFRTVERG